MHGRSLRLAPRKGRNRNGYRFRFDWTDVAGVATYTIQIDDSSSLPRPTNQPSWMLKPKSPSYVKDRLSFGATPSRRVAWHLHEDKRIMTPLTAEQALDTCFLEVRGKLLDLAAILDRIGRGSNAAGVSEDLRLETIRRAMEVLHGRSDGRAERIQKIFSLDYDPAWERPQPRSSPVLGE